MKRFALVVAIAAISACAEPAPTEEPTAAATEAAPAAPEVATLAADGKPSTGKFQVTRADGTVITAEVLADGTYKVTDAAGKVTETGNGSRSHRKTTVKRRIRPTRSRSVTRRRWTTRVSIPRPTPTPERFRPSFAWRADRENGKCDRRR